MEPPKSDMQRRHTEPQFWQYAAAYGLIGGGFVLCLVGAFLKFLPAAADIQGTPIVGAAIMLGGLLRLSYHQNRHLTDRIEELEKQMADLSGVKESKG